MRHRRACPGDLDQDGKVPDYRDGRDKPGDDQLGNRYADSVYHRLLN